MPLLKSSVSQPQETLRKKRKGPKGPNPLSMKKKKVQVMTVSKPREPQVLPKRKRVADDSDNQPTSQPSLRKRRRRAHDNTRSTIIET